MGFFSKIFREVKRGVKKLSKSILPIAVGFLSGGPMGAAAAGIGSFIAPSKPKGFRRGGKSQQVRLPDGRVISRKAYEAELARQQQVTTSEFRGHPSQGAPRTAAEFDSQRRFASSPSFGAPQVAGVSIGTKPLGPPGIQGMGIAAVVILVVLIMFGKK